MNKQSTNIPTSFLGYNREAVKKILKEKDSLLETQRKDIEYLRQELSQLTNKKIEKITIEEPEK